MAIANQMAIFLNILFKISFLFFERELSYVANSLLYDYLFNSLLANFIVTILRFLQKLSLGLTIK